MSPRKAAKNWLGDVVRVSVSLELEQRVWLWCRAHDEGRDMSAVVRQLVDEYRARVEFGAGHKEERDGEDDDDEAGAGSRALRGLRRGVV